jgi:hypothetical protein
MVTSVVVNSKLTNFYVRLCSEVTKGNKHTAEKLKVKINQYRLILYR